MLGGRNAITPSVNSASKGTCIAPVWPTSCRRSSSDITSRRTFRLRRTSAIGARGLSLTLGCSLVEADRAQPSGCSRAGRGRRDAGASQRGTWVVSEDHCGLHGLDRLAHRLGRPVARRDLLRPHLELLAGQAVLLRVDDSVL